MRVLLLTGIYNCKVGGLYNAIVNRVERLKKRYLDSNIDACNIIEIDSIGVRFLKRTAKRDINYYADNEKDKLFTRIINIKNNFKLIFLKNLIPQVYINSIVRKVESKFNISEYDIIHAHWVYPHGYVAYKLAKKYNKKLVVTGHGSDIHTIYKKSEFINEAIKKTLNYSSYLSVVSNGLKNIAINQFGVNSNKIKVINNGVDLDLFKNIYLKSNKKVVGYIGNLSIIKGSDRLLDIFDYINKNMDEIEFIIVGDGELKKELEANMKSKNINAYFTGRVRAEHIPEYICKMDVLILPSRNEGFGMVIIEANACGVPCIASNVGGIPEIINDERLLVDIDKNINKEFGEKTIKILKNPLDRNVLIENAQKYDWNLIVHQEYEMYENLYLKRFKSESK